ncbi:MAG: Holliday junction resolvase RuvX [Verrucomicrobia bacterium]|nr:Holliday junction resolvase RuvX [Verrucomicrobiota bacterium]
MSRTLGIDYGTVRVGLALSDIFSDFASPFDVLQVKSRKQLLADIQAICKEHDVTSIVVGKPLNMDGSFSPMTESAMSFARELARATGLNVETWDERLSSVGAEREMIRADLSRKKRKSMIDKLAAQAVLQGYLDSRRFKRDSDSEF